jgi:hypothetical protein
MLVATTSTIAGEPAMKVVWNDHACEFRPWKPALGRVFGCTFAFDCETTLIDEERPWVAPDFVIGGACNSEHGYFVPRTEAAAFFTAHAGVPVAFHNAPFDLAVLHALAPQADVYRLVDEKLAWDTQLLHRLYVLGSAGHTAGGRGESSLEHCVEVYLGARLPKDVTDSRGNLVRLSYGQWLNRPPHEIEPVYLEYLATDVIATRLVYEKLRRLLQRLLDRSHGVWGFVSPGWLAEQVDLWGPQTHHTQVRAAVVLREITANGLHLDLARRGELARGLEAQLDELRTSLAEFGLQARGKRANRSLQAVLGRLESGREGERFPRTETGRYATSYEALQDLADTVPFLKVLLEYRETEKLLGSFVGKMARRVLHPSFNVLTRTGRTSSFGEINAQNLPTDDRVRSCVIASPGKVFVDHDYGTIELATLSQACLIQFGLDSRMGAAINAGRDLHTLVAARVTHKPESDVTKEERKKAKPINFGKPGGMGDATMRQYAKAVYGVRLSDAEVRGLSAAWFALFPEMRAFLGDAVDTPLELARFLGLTPASHHEHTDDARFLRHPANAGRERQPSAVLGGMCLRVVKAASPRTRAGKPYPAGDVDYFWSRLEARLSALPPKFRPDVLRRQPSARLQRAVMSLVGRAGVFSLTGRLRAAATYSARHNTVFQGLASDGAKLALWLLWRAGYRIVNFIHDEVLIEVPAGSDLRGHALEVRRLMIEGMRAVVPDVAVEVAFAASERWYKDAKAVFDGEGRLLPWSPGYGEEKAPTGT